MGTSYKILQNIQIFEIGGNNFLQVAVEVPFIYSGLHSSHYLNACSGLGKSLCFISLQLQHYTTLYHDSEDRTMLHSKICLLLTICKKHGCSTFTSSSSMKN